MNHDFNIVLFDPLNFVLTFVHIFVYSGLDDHRGSGCCSLELAKAALRVIDIHPRLLFC